MSELPQSTRKPEASAPVPLFGVWQPVETAPINEAVFYWVIPKTADDEGVYENTSEMAIVTPGFLLPDTFPTVGAIVLK